MRAAEGAAVAAAAKEKARSGEGKQETGRTAWTSSPSLHQQLREYRQAFLASRLERERLLEGAWSSKAAAAAAATAAVGDDGETRRRSSAPPPLVLEWSDAVDAAADAVAEGVVRGVARELDEALAAVVEGAWTEELVRERFL